MFLFSFCDVHWLIPFLLPALLLLIPYIIFTNGWKKRIEELTQLRRKDSDRLAKVEGELNLSRGKLLSTEDKLSTAFSENKRLKSIVPTAAYQSDTSEEIEEYRQKITALEGELALKSGDVSISQEQHESYRQRITFLEGELALKSGEVRISEDEEDTYRSRVTALEGELALAQGKIKEDEERIESYRNQISDINRKDNQGNNDLTGEVIPIAQYSNITDQSDISVLDSSEDWKAESTPISKLRKNHDPESELDIIDIGNTNQGNTSKSTSGQLKPSVEIGAPEGSGFKTAREGKFSNVGENDLTAIDGIGPKTADLLAKKDIKTWAALSIMTPAKLKEILSDAGSRYNHMDPSTWPRQANLAAGNHWTRLETLQDKIDGGKINSQAESDKKTKTSKKAKSKRSTKKSRKNRSARFKNLDKVKESNLQIIEGIGPKMNQVLTDNKLGTWSALASKSPGEVRLILDKYGDKYKIIDPKGWSKQASYASKGKWKKLIKYQKTDGSASKAEKVLTKLGVISPPTQPDDLKIIEGIGPKISDVLESQGITTWTKLSKTSVKELKAILNGAGKRYGLADPKTWPKQAKLAAAGRFDKLEKLQASI